MKKVLSIAAAVTAIALVLSFAGCGAPSNEPVRKPSSVSTNPPVSEDTQLPGKQEENIDKEIQAPEKQEASISETALVEEAGVKITAKSLDNNGFMGPEVKLLIENDSGKDLTFQCRNVSVNGYMADAMMSVDVVTGKKANDSLAFMSSDLELLGISTIADMEFSFHIFTTEGWDDYLDTPQIQLKTSAADTYEYTFDDSVDVLYDENGIRLIVKGLAENSSIFGPSIMVYIENNSDKNITVQTRDVSLNGFMLSPVFSSDVAIGKHAVDAITFLSSELEENDITTIENAELSFHIFDAAGWDTIVDTEPIIITF